MKVVYISDSSIPSTSPNSVHVMRMCQAFSELGHEVTLVAKNTTACLKGISDIYAFYAVRKNFALKIFPRISFTGSGAFYNLSLAWRIFGLDADLVYTRSITAAFFLLLFRKSVVFEVHEPYEGKGLRIRSMFRFVAHSRHLRKLVVISSALKAYYENSFKLPSEIMVAHDGADPFPDVKPVLDRKGFKIGYVGSLYVGKGMEILLPLAKACPDVQFHIVGGNEVQVEENRNKAMVLGVGNLVFHGFKSQRELPGYISSFDAVIAPYSSFVRVSEKKGANNLALWMSPLKIFEYMSAGKPIIASDLPVIREILQDEQTALLCDPERLDTWIRALERLRNDPTLQEALAKKSFDTFAEKYTWKKRAEQILNGIG